MNGGTPFTPVPSGPKKPPPPFPHPGLSRPEVWQLATFNGERGRGIVHTREYTSRMAELQRRFDYEQRVMSRQWVGDYGLTRSRFRRWFSR